MLLERVITHSVHGTITKVKSLRYHKQVNQDENIRCGNVIPSYIEAEIFASSNYVPDVGDEITYVRRYYFDSDFNELNSGTGYQQGKFYVKEKYLSDENIYTIIAYDHLCKLDINYSSRLLELKEAGSFPITIIDLVDDAVTYAGLTHDFNDPIVVQPGTPKWWLNRLPIEYFYSDTITCRDIVEAYCELVGCFVETIPVNGITIDSYGTYLTKDVFRNSNHYIICPTDQVSYYDDNHNLMTPVFYKQGGLTKADYTVAATDQVIIVNASGVQLGMYPSPMNAPNPSNIYYITNNLLANFAVYDKNNSDHTMGWRCAAELAYLQLQSSYTPMEIKLFLFRNPYIDNIDAIVEDKDGNRSVIPVMSIDEDDSGVTINAFGQSKKYDVISSYDTADQKNTLLTARVNNLSNTSGYFASVISGKKVSIIGDSISTFDANGYKVSGYAMYYPNVAVPDVETVQDTWWKKVLDACGCVIEVNASYSGSTAAKVDSKPTFYERCGSNIIGNPDTIIVALGTNDSNNSVAIGDFDFTTAYTSLSETTFATAYIKGIKALQNNFPNAQIICVALNMGGTYRNAIVRIATYLGCKYVTCHDYEKGSGSHPNAHGMRQIASAVLALQTTDSTFTTEVVPTQYIENGTIYLNDDSYTFGVAPSANITSNGVNWKDLQNETVAFIRHYIRTSGEYRILAQVNGKSGNNTVSHYTYMAVDGSGNPYVSCSHPAAWRRALGLNYATNDTFTPANTFSAYGYVTSSTKNIHFNFPVEKSMEDITTITVTALTGAIRGASGYVDGGSLDWTSGYTVTADKVSNNIVHVQISKSAAFSNVTNNTSLVGNFTIGLKFT